MNRSLAETTAGLPPIPTDSVLPVIKAKIRKLNRTVVVLDDDPTGTQTVFDVPVVTHWSVETLSREFNNKTELFFILTNSRSHAEDRACEIAREIGINLMAASRQTGRQFEVISRSDSTLRGHYPAEVLALAEAIDQKDSAQILIPFFIEGGRVTVDDIHFVISEDEMIPAAETPFAADATFGYSCSDLKHWVAEKTKGGVSSADVNSVSVKQLRTDSAAVTEMLLALAPGSVTIVNCLTMRDLEVFTDCALKASLLGCNFIYRTAASFVQTRAGLASRELLTSAEIVNTSSRSGGLIVVGSHVPKTTSQLRELLNRNPELVSIELAVKDVVSPTSREKEIKRATEVLKSAIDAGQDVVLFTSRELIVSDRSTGNLQTGQLISSALVEIVSELESQPRFLIAKGGITSSDIATEALQVQRAQVIGQILPGVPVWRLSKQSKFPDMSYVVFPGNVGDDGALAEAYEVVKPIE